MNDFVKDSIKERQKINREIVAELARRVEEQPTMRFSQIVIDVLPKWKKEGVASAEDLCSIFFNEEPAVHLARLYERYTEPTDKSS